MRPGTWHLIACFFVTPHIYIRAAASALGMYFQVMWGLHGLSWRAAKLKFWTDLGEKMEGWFS